ncbi:toxin-antitoxin system HicB family antitoxin [Nocardioides sp. GXQ0305]|uniref:toxin-antitoxin system HicB family antitoxin n=1 Tax=Nocardioides sp. GXQ0305 TaxID=3423912 RepID=UPI003D7D88DA
MDITPYVDSLRSDLVAAAEAGGDDIRQAAERLVVALAPAARLALMEAISQAAAEITAELPDGGVDVRLDGRELDFVVHVAGPPAPPAPPPPPAAEEADEGGLARVTLRIPESVKARAEEKAARAGDSLNTWLVKVVRAATLDAAADVRDLTSIPLDAFDPFRRSNRRMSGWL